MRRLSAFHLIFLLLAFSIHALNIVQKFSDRFTRRVRFGDAVSNDEIHDHFMRLALKQASKAGRQNEVPIGALVVCRQENYFEILASTHNRVEQKFDASAHAELLAMQRAAKRIRNWRLQNCTVYSTLEPCVMCLAACQAFRVEQIVYAANDIRLGALGSHLNLLDHPHPFHTIQNVTKGVQQNESASLLKGFFRKRRGK